MNVDQNKDNNDFGKRIKKREKNSIFAVLLIIIGIVFLLNNFGILPWIIWREIWRFWPVLLIIVGIKNIFGKSYLGMFISNLLNIIIILFVFIYALALTDPFIMDYLKTQFPQISGLFEYQTSYYYLR